MKKGLKYNRFFGFRTIVFVVVLSGMLIQITGEVFTVLVQSDNELVDLDFEEKSNEKESQEDDNEDKKTEFLVFNSYCSYYDGILLQNSDRIQNNRKNITQDIPSPPPDVA